MLKNFIYMFIILFLITSGSLFWFYSFLPAENTIAVVNKTTEKSVLVGEIDDIIDIDNTDNIDNKEDIEKVDKVKKEKKQSKNKNESNISKSVDATQENNSTDEVIDNTNSVDITNEIEENKIEESESVVENTYPGMWHIVLEVLLLSAGLPER